MTTRGLRAALALAALALVSSCTYYLVEPVPDGDGKPDGQKAPVLTVLVQPDRPGLPYHPGDTLTIRWSGGTLGAAVSVHLCLLEDPVLEIRADYAGTDPLDWTIPDGTAPSEVYRVRVVELGKDKVQPVEGFSEPFAIDREPDTGLSDVTVTARHVTLTVTDNGALVDGDTIDVRLNGVPVVESHVLAGPPGTSFPVDLASGSNLLEIVAITEGEVAPNTAQLEISDVSVGEAVQVWRLAALETGSLVITAP